MLRDLPNTDPDLFANLHMKRKNWRIQRNLSSTSQEMIALFLWKLSKMLFTAFFLLVTPNKSLSLCYWRAMGVLEKEIAPICLEQKKCSNCFPQGLRFVSPYTGSDMQQTSRSLGSRREQQAKPVATFGVLIPLSQHPSTTKFTVQGIAGETLNSLNEIVKQFRSGIISRGKSIGQITSALLFDSTKSNVAKELALDKYISTINSLTQLHSGLFDHGRRVAKEIVSTEAIHTGDKPRNRNEPNKPIMSKSSRVRSRSVSDTSKPDSQAGLDDKKKLSNKKQRLYKQDMLWFQKAKLAQSAPAGFPTSEWENIVRGISVNIDNVYSSLHHVQTSGNWSSAFNKIIKATSFVFPHRETKLRKYSEYINGEFSLKVDLSHRKIVLYDAAVRNKVAGGQQMLLTNRNKFSFIYSAIVMPDGIESNHNKQLGSHPNGAKSQVDYCYTNTSAASANAKAIVKSTVTARAKRTQGLRPKFLCYNIWAEDQHT
ncbi:hypothetical protein B0H34DRAFT_674208 [Crassisporium funariophilum]|nr:hypothetical protein B0H34DRAFT_674208 [Crassisporium funariophilum]